MKKLSQDQIAEKLQAAPYPRASSNGELADPLVETPMRVTLVRLRPYEHNPRFIRNPLFDELKASIRERGLDQPPPITRRPGAKHFIIRNGGNTRLTILGELWQETRDERFFHIHCLFRPWDGEISALLGHLAENDLHGQLTFIERAVAVAKAKELIECDGEQLSQRELARRLAAGGYSIPQPHISRMFDTLEHLLPAIPQVLYQGLGRHQIERLIIFRNYALKVWQEGGDSSERFTEFWFDTLSGWDTSPATFEVDQVEHTIQLRLSELFPPRSYPQERAEKAVLDRGKSEETAVDKPVLLPTTGPPASPQNAPLEFSSSRVKQIREMVDQACADQPVHSVESTPPESFEAAWNLDQSLDTTKQLRKQIAHQTRQLLASGNSLAKVHSNEEGLGFTLSLEQASTDTPLAISVNLLLGALMREHDGLDWQDRQLLPSALFGQLLLGIYDIDLPNRPAQDIGLARLPDDVLLSFIRLLRLARRLVDYESTP
ncbi:ParB family protein [Pseudomonas sp. LRF_L74]|uniref:ParB family protein n=1 Tax=Pseudomonas sp. LRF_L74 TaxID=3369422 RepID=UPI003F6118F1